MSAVYDIAVLGFVAVFIVRVSDLGVPDYTGHLRVRGGRREDAHDLSTTSPGEL